MKDKIKEIKVFKTEDGKIFEKYEEAQKHIFELILKKKIAGLIEMDVCARDFSEDVKEVLSNFILANFEFLMLIDKEK